LRSEPLWLPIEEVIETNKQQVGSTREPFGVLDMGLLESGIARPKQHWSYGEEDDMLILAVKLLLGIAQNHPFRQGNKRTAFISAATFLEMNGYELDHPDGEDLGRFVKACIEHKLSEDGLIDILRPYVKEVEV
jgi:death-on-curing protein